MPARRLFLSYARPERARVATLAQNLNRAGCEVFFDENLTTGEEWWNTLLDQIEACDAFVPVLSNAYVVSTPCRLEVEYAHALGKPLLPIMIEAMNPDECVSIIADTQCLQYDHADANSALDLARALMTCPDCPDLPDEMPARPAVPRSYAGQTVQALRARLDVTDDLTRQEQVLLLADLKNVMETATVSDTTSRELLRELGQRPELIVSVANEITALLAEAHDAPAPSPVPPPPDDANAEKEKVDEPSPPPPPPPDNNTVDLSCSNCSTVNRVPKGKLGYICRSCEGVNVFPRCKACNKTCRLCCPKGGGSGNYSCPACKSRQFFTVLASESSLAVPCTCSQWNVFPQKEKGFTCGACGKQHVFCRCPKCKEGRCLEAPKGKSRFVPWKSACGKQYTIPKAGAACRGVVTPASTLFPTGSALD